MGHVGDKIRLQDLRCPQLLGHDIEILVDLPNLPETAPLVQPHVKVASGHLPHGLSQLDNGIKEPFAQVVSHSAAHDDAEEEDPDSL